MGKLRTNSTEDFPVESRSGGISYILIRPSAGGDGYSHYKATKTEKTKLLKQLTSINDYDDVTLLGIWTGRHRTDTHVLKLPKFVERMEDSDL